MIFYASQRGRSAELAAHLLNGDQNDHVTVHDIRGFVSNNITEALREAYAMSRGTRCKQFLFSVSLNPPETADVSVEDFEAAIEMIEQRLGLTTMPRIVVFHEKNGRRHCHAVWSRIDTEKLVAVRMAHFKIKLMEVSRLLFLRHGWKMPKGMQKGQRKDPFNLTRQEYRQAVRLAEDPQALKGMFKAAWEQSDSKETFARALQENGFLLARGDKRGFVALDVKGGVYSLTRWIDMGTRDLKARLGKPETLPDVTQARSYLASRMTENLNRFIAEAKTMSAEKRTPLVQELKTIVHQQRQDRRELLELQQARWTQETKLRSQRLYTGVSGIWQRVTGEYQKVRLRNEAEAKKSHERDAKELHGLIRAQLLEQQELQKTVKFYKAEHKTEVFRLRQEIARYVITQTEPPQLPAAKATSVATVDKVPLAAQLAQVEVKLGLLSGDISMLQASLESNLLSDEQRGRIRLLIEKTLTVLQLKVIETKEEQKLKIEEKTKEIQARQEQFNDYVREYATLQLKVEAEVRQQAANRAFVEFINNMSYSLNGVPRWNIAVMSPPLERRLDEREYVQKVVLQRDNSQLLDRVFKSPENESQVSKRPPIDPKIAVPNLRQNVLEVNEMLMRAGIKPRGGEAASAVAPTQVKLTAATKISFNNIK